MYPTTPNAVHSARNIIPCPHTNCVYIFEKQTKEYYGTKFFNFERSEKKELIRFEIMMVVR